MNELTKCY